MMPTDVRAKLIKTMCRFTHNETLAEDVVDEAIYRVTALAHKRAAVNIFPWLYQIARNLILDHQKHDQVVRRRSPILWNSIRQRSPVHEAAVRELEESIDQALEKLRPKERRAFELLWKDDLDDETAGALMGVTANYARNLAWKAKQKLKSHLAPYSNFSVA